MVWVKICGTTNLHDAELSIAAGADAIGFIFAPSPRRVEVATAAAIIAKISDRVEAVGVFVNETPERIAEVAAEAGLTLVQLHGDEPAASLPEFRRVLGDRKIIKTLQAREVAGIGIAMLREYLSAKDNIDAILLDAGSAQQRGGTGSAFDWSGALPLAAEIRGAIPLIIAGGLDAGNVSRAVGFFDPWGVDVVSGVESAPGRKDEKQVRGFVAAVRQEQVSIR